MSATETINQIRQQFPGGNISYRINKHGCLKKSYKGPDGIIHPIATRVNRDATSRVRLQQRYHQQKRFSVLDHLHNPTRFVENLLQQWVPAVIASDDYGSVVITNRPECIKPSQQHKLIKIVTDHRGYNYDVESISEADFKQLQQQLELLSG